MFSGDNCLYRYVKNQVFTLIDRTGYQGLPQIPPEVRGGDPPEPNHTRYCGYSKKCPDEGIHSNPVDCIDIACASHDRCLYRYQHGFNTVPAYLFCAEILCNKSRKCLEKGCNSAPNSWCCQWVSFWIAEFFCKIAKIPHPGPPNPR